MKFLSTLYIFCLSVLFFSCKQKPQQKEKHDEPIATLIPKLEKIWETDTLLTTCESVLYDKKSSLIYVSNINENPWGKDSDGFISTIDTLGNVINLKWIDGIHGPKGMGIYNNKLYVNDIDEVLTIDIASQKITERHLIAGEPKLNDISVSPEGTVYISGMGVNTIYSLKNNKIDTVGTSDFQSINGVLHQPEGIFYLSADGSKFGLFNLKDKTAKVLTEDIGAGDGAIRLKNGDFIISNWKGQVFYIKSSDWSKQLLLDTQENNVNAADIDFIPEHDLLLVPTFFDNRVVAYRLKFE